MANLPLQHEPSYYGEDRYDTGANPVYKSKNPFDLDNVKEIEAWSEHLRAGMSFSDEEPAKSDGSDPINFGGKQLKRLSSLSKMIPNIPKVLSPTHKSSSSSSHWTRMEDDVEQKVDDEVFETGRSSSDEQRKLKKRGSFLGRFKSGSQ